MAFVIAEGLGAGVRPDTLAVRVGLVAALGTLAAALYRERTEAAAVALAFGVALLDMLAGCAVVALTGRARSELVAGLYLVQLAPAVFFVMRPALHASLATALAVPALATLLAYAPEGHVGLVRAAFFGLTAALGYLAGRSAYGLRRREADAIASLGRAQEALREAQLELAEAEKLATMGTLAARVAHELDQPLTALSSDADLLAERLQRAAPLEPGELLDPVSRMRQAARRMAEIVEHLRVWASRSQSSTGPTSLNDVARGALLFIEGELAERGIALSVELPDEPPLVPGNLAELEQAVLNLLTNARDAVEGRPQPQIGVRVLIRDGSAVLQVRDSGPGVPANSRDEIFRPFFTTKPPGVGTGLGLSIARSILARHGGRLEIAATGPEGSVFEAVLPVLPDEEAAPAVAEADRAQ